MRIIDEILKFCISSKSDLTAIDSKIDLETFKEDLCDELNDYMEGHLKYHNDKCLSVLPNLESFDAIFINDDPNWYTVYNELNIIKKLNSSFPLVFVCNNKYPHKRRDFYTNPEDIPEEYKNECCIDLPIVYEEGSKIKRTMIKDGFCHAIYKDTPKNGVLTAIEDFLAENKSLTLLDINPLDGVSLIYKSSNIVDIRINKILEEKIESEYAFGDLLDKVIENNLLLRHIRGMNLLKDDLVRVEEFKTQIEEKDSILKEYENKIDLYNTQMQYHDSQINNIESQVSLKETQLQSVEAKLLNKENELSSKDDLIKSKDSELISKNNELQAKVNEINSLKSQLNEMGLLLNHRESQLKISEAQLETKSLRLNALENKQDKQYSKLSNKEYCLNCYEEEINNQIIEIEYLKSDKISKKLLIPLAYVYLITKAPLEIVTNIKLYKSLKSSECFDIGYYLNKYPDISKSKWCKYFSPELHYVCNGFNEGRKFNKKYYNVKSKKDLLVDVKRK